MVDIGNWDWQQGKKILADISELKSRFKRVDEFVVSPDGEFVAVPVRLEDDSFSICVNGEAKAGQYELLWYLRYLPNGKLVCFVRIDDEWTLAVDDTAQDERFEYAWNLSYAKDGDSIAYQCKRDNQYGVAIDGKPWEQNFLAMRDYCLSPDGKHAAATVQVEPLKEADVPGFFEGVWSVAADGKAWDKRYVNAWKPSFDDDSKLIAVEIRTGICDYSIAVNGESWGEIFGCVWEPIFKRQSASVIAPVRHGGKWTIAEDGKLIWDAKYNQLWAQRLSPDGSSIAAAASLDHGKWTIAVNDNPWKREFRDMVLAPVFSPDSKKVAAIVKENNRWTIAVDGQPWPDDFEMIWDPAFSPCSGHVIAKAERDGEYFVVYDGKVSKTGYEALWEPQFSPDGDMVLLRYIADGKYCREVKSTGDLPG